MGAKIRHGQTGPAQHRRPAGAPPPSPPPCINRLHSPHTCRASTPHGRGKAGMHEVPPPVLLQALHPAHLTLYYCRAVTAALLCASPPALRVWRRLSRTYR